MKNLPLIFLMVSLYLGWFGCVIAGREGLDFYSLFFPALCLILLRVASKPSRTEWFKLFTLVALGALIDSGLLWWGVIVFPLATHSDWLPIWMVSLWLLFVPSLSLMARAFGNRYWFAALMGAVFGPLTYASGESFAVMQLAGASALVIYAVVWSIYLPLAFYWLGKKLL